MTILFTPVPRANSVATAAGSGQVQRWTYTVPALKRAILYHSMLRIVPNGAAAGTLQNFIQCTIGGTAIVVCLLDGSGAVNNVALSYMPSIDLQAGDIVAGFTVNNSAVVTTMQEYAVIREYN